MDNQMKSFRIQLTENNSIKKPKAGTVIVANKYDDLVKLSSSKFKLNPTKHKIRFFIARQTVNGKIGTEIKNEEDFVQYVTNDIMLAVSNGEQFKGKADSSEKYNPSLENKINRPPRHPYPFGFDNESQSIEKVQTPIDNLVVDNLISDIKTCSEKRYIVSEITMQPSKTKEMSDMFPLLKGNVLNLIEKAIESNPKIKAFDRDGYISFDYEADAVFTDIKDWNNLVQRECRGLIVSSKTGKILARRFHKFFNIDEREETLLKNIDLTDAVIQEKLDGSLVSPIMFEDKNIIWATRRNKSPEVETFISTCKDIDYNGLAKHYLSSNITPLFEWCHDSIRVGVLCYPSKQLVLLALRHNESGEYINIDTHKELIEGFGVPIVNDHKIDYSDVNNINKLLKCIKESTDREGIVLTLGNGTKYKFKSYWYISLCYAQKFGEYFLPEMIKLNPNIKSVPSDKIWFTALSNIDDVVSLTISLLNSSDAIIFNKFVNEVQSSVELLKKDLEHWFIESFDLIGDKRPIQQVGIKSGWDEKLITLLTNNQDINELLKKFLIKMVKNNQISSVEELLDIKWMNGDVNYSNTILSLGNLHSCSHEIKTHILSTYLTKKMSNYLGIQSINSQTIINLSNNYISDEGKLIGMWEAFTKNNIWDLRIDLQPQRKTGYTQHYGNSEYALFLVQYGLFNNLDEKPHGEFAGILVPTNSNVEFGDMVSAMEQSFNYKQIIKLRRKKQNLIKYKIFCDLDGVLADFERGVIDLTGRSIDSQTSSKMWTKIFSCPKFFENLNPTSYCDDLWNKISLIGGQIPTILSGVPQGKKQYPMEKLSWCKKNLNADMENIITCKSTDKYKYSNLGHVLIDDNYSNGIKWVHYGGIFIHHITPERTIYELERLFNIKDKIKVNISQTLDMDYYTSNIPVYFIDSEFNDSIELFSLAKLNSVVSIDSEWDPTSTSSVSIIQLCVNNQVYIIDWINTNNRVVEQVEQILKDNSIIKICFGLDKNELKRLNTSIYNVVDIQEVISDNFDFQISNLPSLALTCSGLLGKKLNKSKELQAGKWATRPLSPEQLYYAKCDVIILFELLDKINSMSKNKFQIPKNLIVCSSNKNNNIKGEDDKDLKKPVKILQSGVFLSEQSTKTLLEFIKGIHKYKHASHITLKYKPHEWELKGLPVGELVSIKVNAHYKDEFIQGVRCECMGKTYYITISSVELANVYNEKIFMDVVDWDILDPGLQLFGQVGVQVVESQDLLASLPEKIKKSINEFQQNALREQKLKFKANELSAKERSIVHEYAKQMGIGSESTGREGSKKLVLTMGWKKNQEPDSNFSSPIIKIVDKYYFSMLNIIGDDFNTGLGGKVMDNGYINSNLDIYNLGNDVIYILRGLPGSGKSIISKYFLENFDSCSSCSSCSVCSADEYFCKDGIYLWDKTKINLAHEFCYEQVVQSVKNKTNFIIVDNTSSRLNEFSKYIELAKTFNYKTIILEIYCKNKEQAITFCKRGAHTIPIQDILKMYDRWETSDDTILLEPYFINNNTLDIKTTMCLNKWLDEKRVCHFTKSRNKTHLIMEIGSCPARFLDIGDEYVDEFLKIYSADPEPKYIMELITDKDSKFKLFFDFDYVSDIALDTNSIFEIGRILLKSINSPELKFIYITSCTSIAPNNKIKTGIHFKCDGLSVIIDEALVFREGFIKELNIYDEKINWDLVVDKEVFSPNKGIRMFGSRKVTTGIDVGHVYEFIGCVDFAGNKNMVELDDVDLLKKLSIKCN
jgi:hypothetical protein